MKRKFLALILSVLMLVSLMPTAALAAATENCANDKSCTTHAAAIGTTHYDTLAEAIAAVPTDGTETTIKMLANITEMTTDQILEIASGQNVVLDMAGHSITVANAFQGRPIENRGTLKVTGNGIIDSTASASGGYGAINNFGTLTIENGTFRGATYANGSAIYNRPNATLTINNGTFDTATRAVANSSQATINNGSFTGTTCSRCNSSTWAYTIVNYDTNARMVINGGTFIGTQGAASSSVGYLEVNGGTFKTQDCSNNHGAIFYALYAAGEAGEVECVINGGTFETSGRYAAVLIGNDNKNGDGGIYAQATAYVNGGTFTAPEGVPALKGAAETGDPVITGGTFSSDPTAYVDNSTHVVSNEGSSYIVAARNASNSEAKIGDIYYDTLANAISAATSGQTVTLLRNAEVVLNDTGSAYDTSDKTLWYEQDNITIDFDNHKLTVKSRYGGSYNVLNILGTRWNLKNGEIVVKRGESYENDDSYALAVEKEGASFTMENMKLHGGIALYNTVTATLKQTNFVMATNYYAIYLEGGAVANIVGGTYESNGNQPIIYACEGCSASISNGSFTGSIFGGGGLLSVTGGTFSSAPTAYVKNNGTDYIVKRDGTSSYTYTVLPKSNLESGVYLTNPEGALASRYYISSTANSVWTVSYNPPSDSDSTTTTPSQPTTSTETKPDGSTTTTESKPDGTTTESNTSAPTTDASGNTSQTTTETTTGKDGVTESKTETVTKPDGSASSTTESTTTKPDGTKTESTTETTINKDGSTASTTTSTTTGKDGTVTESKTEATTSTVTNADGSTTETKQETTTTSTGSKTESTTVTTVNTDGSTTATTTATTTDKAGTVTESKTESTTNKNGTTTEKTTTTETKANGTVTESKTETTINTDGSSKATTTATVTKADGTTVESKTEATTSLSTNKTTGTVTETKKETTTTSTGVKSEGTTVTQIRKDGTVTSTETVKASDSTGTTATKTTTLDAKGEVTTKAEATVSTKAVTEAAKTGGAVTLPVEVTATKSASTAPTVAVKVPATAESVKVELPVQNVTPGTVAVIVKADGTEEIVKTSIVTEDGVALNVDGNAQIKLVDNSTTFIDVRPVDHWASDEIDFSTSRELFKGTSDTTFTPEGTVTRAMLYTVMARFDDADVVTTGANWYADSLEWAKANNVSDGTNPTGNITREQLATMLYRYVGEPAVTGSTDSYADAGSVSDYAAAAMQWAVENGLINGINGRLQPQGYATRAQLAAIMQRFCANVMF